MKGFNVLLKYINLSPYNSLLKKFLQTDMINFDQLKVSPATFDVYDTGSLDISDYELRLLTSLTLEKV